MGLCYRTELLVFEQHVVIGRQAQARLEDVLDAGTLLGQSVDDRRVARHKRCLEQVRQGRHHGVEALVLGSRVVLERDARQQLGQQDEIDDERSGQQRVLAGVVHDDGVVAAHKDLARVLVHGALAVADVRHVLDDNHVVGMLVLGVQHAVGRHHVVDDVALGDLLGAELARRREVLAVVVAEMVVADDRHGLDAGGNQPVDHDGLHLGLARLEVVAANEHAVLLGQLDAAGHKCVLWTAVDVDRVLENRRHSEQRRRRDLGLVAVDGGQQVLGRVIDALGDLGESLSVGAPEHHHLVDVVVGLEAANVGAHLLELLALRAAQNVVGTRGLVGGHKVRIVDRRHRHNVDHVGAQLALEIVVQHLSTLHGIGQRKVVDIPTANNKIVRVDLWVANTA
jgi:hypothetical protein